MSVAIQQQFYEEEPQENNRRSTAVSFKLPATDLTIEKPSEETGR